MANKKIWLGILVTVFGMMVVGCPDGSTGDDETDTWTNVTSLMQLNGTWKCSYRTESEGIMETWEATMTITATNATTGTMSDHSVKVTYSGITNTQWQDIKAKFVNSETETCTFNDSTHTVTMTISSQPIELSDFNGQMINQNGTKLRDGQMMIYTKQ
jgi:hypothetical protein